MSAKQEMDNFYQILGVSSDASAQEIKESYRQLVRHHHPDANPANRDAAEAMMKEVLVAYATLSDPEKRAAFDQQTQWQAIERLRDSGQSMPPGSPGHPGTTPQSLIGKVRVALDETTAEFAGKLGISEMVLAEFEARDAVPQMPLQMRTFANLVEKAAQKLAQNGQEGQSNALRIALNRKKANRNFFR